MTHSPSAPCNTGLHRSARCPFKAVSLLCINPRLFRIKGTYSALAVHCRILWGPRLGDVNKWPLCMVALLSGVANSTVWRGWWYCLSVSQSPGNMAVYLRDGSAEITVRAATLRQKWQITFAISHGHNVLTPGHPVSALIF